MSEPRRLHDASQEPNRDVVEALERMLVLAKAGNLRGVVVLGFHPTESYFENAGEWDAPHAFWTLETWKHRFLHIHQEDLGQR